MKYTVLFIFALSACSYDSPEPSGQHEPVEILVTDKRYVISGTEFAAIDEWHAVIQDQLNLNGPFIVKSCHCADNSRLIEVMGVLSGQGAELIQVGVPGDTENSLCEADCR